jgi:hypothetical protein
LEQLAPSYGDGGTGASVRDADQAGHKTRRARIDLELAVRVLRASFARPTLNEDEAMDLIDYYLERDDVAHKSHRKSWLAKHKQLAKKLVL